MARGKTSASPTVSLFPFLAVLVCVMGSLIFLLLATTKRMHDVAVAEAEARLAAEHPAPPEPAPSPPTVPPLPELPRAVVPTPHLGEPRELAAAAAPAPADDSSEIAAKRQKVTAELEDKLSGLRRRRDELLTALRKHQALQTAAQGKVEALQASVGESETKLRGVLAQIDAFKDDLTPEEDLAALEEQIKDLRKKLRQLQNRQAAGQTKFTVVPFDVRSGTTRRPILIECTDHGLRFLPEDVVITPNDLEGFTEQSNPLLAGAQALMSYWTAWNMRQPNPDDKPEPYVLLMVRPNGTVGYYVAMKMLNSLKQPHGYELIDDAIVLQPPPLDPEAQRVLREAVQRQLGDRAEVAKDARNVFRGGTAGTPRGKSRPRTSDKFEVADVMPPSEDATVSERSWENIERFEGRRPASNAAGSGDNTAKRPGGAKTTRPKSGANNPKDAAADRPPRERTETAAADPVGGGNVYRPATRSRPVDAGERPSSDEEPSAAPAGDRARGTGSAARAGSARVSNYRPPSAPRPSDGRRPRSDDAGPIAQLAKLGRRHWGDSEPNANIGVEQDVFIRVDAEQMVVADHLVVRYQAGEQSFDLFLRLMEAVDAEAETWGKPRPGFYWTPRLRFVISPGGNQMFERIDPLTIRSGLAATREFTLEGVSAAKGESQP